VRKLLGDPEPLVRLKVALALALVKEKEAIPVLIALLGELSPEQAWPAEDLLLRLAGEQAPQVTLGADDGTRRRCRDVWAAWWREHGARADLARLEGAGQMLGFTLVVLLDGGKVVELGRDDKPRWEIAGVSSPLDAQALPGSRVLTAESDRVTERDLK